MIRSDLPDIRPGDTVRVHQKIKEGDKERISMFEGLVIARKHGDRYSMISLSKECLNFGVPIISQKNV